MVNMVVIVDEDLKRIIDEGRYVVYQLGYHKAKNNEPMMTEEEFIKEHGLK